MKTQNTGLVSLIDDKEEHRGFFCMELAGFIFKEQERKGLIKEERGALWELRFDQAKEGQCAYRDNCPIYARTKKRPKQLSLFQPSEITNDR